MVSKLIAVCVLFFIKLPFFGYWSICLVIRLRVLGMTKGLTIDCNVVCWKGVLFLLCGVVSVG